MLWIEYQIEQSGHNFKVKGDWEGEVMGIDANGAEKDYWLYKPGDVFRVTEDGWLCKIHEKDGVPKE